MAEAFSITGALLAIIIPIYSQIHNTTKNIFNVMVSGTFPFWRKWGASRLNKMKISPITRGVDDLATAKKAKIAIQGIIERTPSKRNTSPVVVLRILRVNGEPTIAILSNSDHYNDQLKTAIHQSDEFNLDALGLEVMTKKELFAPEPRTGEENMVMELVAGEIKSEKRGDRFAKELDEKMLKRSARLGTESQIR